MSTLIMIADLKDPADPEGRTYRQVNAAKSHFIQVGSLVEIYHDDPLDEHDMDGVRLFVVKHTRDCDQTPLYSLAADPTKDDEYSKTKWLHGYSEENLRRILMPR